MIVSNIQVYPVRIQVYPVRNRAAKDLVCYVRVQLDNDLQLTGLKVMQRDSGSFQLEYPTDDKDGPSWYTFDKETEAEVLSQILAEMEELKL